MSDYAELLREDQRLALLRQLAEAQEYTAHEHILRVLLRQDGVVLSADALRGHLAWLDEQGLIVLAGGQVQVATLTTRGEDVARGRARHPGIARPRP